MTYLTRINKVYYARLAVPFDLQPIINRKELKKSLHTEDYREAKVLLAKVLHEWHQQFFRMRFGVDMTAPSQSAIEILQEIPPVKFPIRSTLSSEPVYDPNLRRIHNLLDMGYEHGNSGKRRFIRTAQENKPTLMPSVTNNEIATLTVEDAIEQWLNSEEVKALSGVGRGNTQSTYRSALKHLSKVAQGKTLEETNTYDFLYEFFNKTLRSYSQSTRGKVLSAVYQMLNYHHTKKNISSIPPKVKIILTVIEKHTERSRTPNDPYPIEKLQALFNSFEKPAKLSNNKDSRLNHLRTVYATALALYTGLRVEDLSHLQVSDFIFDAPIPYLIQEDRLITFENENGEITAKTTNKSSNSMRIPIHKDVLNLGLSRFVSIFKITEKPFKSCTTITQRLTAQLEAFEIRQQGQLMHAFRKTLDNKYVALGIPHDIKEILMGHRISGVAGKYTKAEFQARHELPALNEHVQKLNFGVDFTQLSKHLEDQLGFFTQLQLAPCLQG